MTLPPSFPVEKQEERMRAYQEISKVKSHISKLLEAVFPKEIIADGMTLPKRSIFFLWRPNNYRLKIPFLSEIDGKQEIKVIPGIFPVESEGRGVLTMRPNKSITLQISSKSVVVIFSLKKDGEKAWYQVNCKDVDDFDKWLDAKVVSLADVCKAAAGDLGLSLDMDRAVWIRQEDGVKREEFLDSIPKSLVMNDSYFKKVYKDEVEFKSPGYVKNYISNRAIESLVPSLAKEINDIHLRIDKSLPIRLEKPLIGASWVEWQAFFRQEADKIGLKYEEV